MNNQVITSLIISVLYLITKFIEMRFILKENKPLSLEELRKKRLEFYSIKV